MIDRDVTDFTVVERHGRRAATAPTVPTIWNGVASGLDESTDVSVSFAVIGVGAGHVERSRCRTRRHVGREAGDAEGRPRRTSSCGVDGHLDDLGVGEVAMLGAALSTATLKAAPQACPGRHPGIAGVPPPVSTRRRPCRSARGSTARAARGRAAAARAARRAVPRAGADPKVLPARRRRPAGAAAAAPYPRGRRGTSRRCRCCRPSRTPRGGADGGTPRTERRGERWRGMAAGFCKRDCHRDPAACARLPTPHASRSARRARNARHSIADWSKNAPRFAPRRPIPQRDRGPREEALGPRDPGCSLPSRTARERAERERDDDERPARERGPPPSAAARAARGPARRRARVDASARSAGERRAIAADGACALVAISARLAGHGAAQTALPPSHSNGPQDVVEGRQRRHGRPLVGRLRDRVTPRRIRVRADEEPRPLRVEAEYARLRGGLPRAPRDRAGAPDPLRRISRARRRERAVHCAREAEHRPFHMEHARQSLAAVGGEEHVAPGARERADVEAIRIVRVDRGDEEPRVPREVRRELHDRRAAVVGAEEVRRGPLPVGRRGEVDARGVRRGDLDRVEAEARDALAEARERLRCEPVAVGARRTRASPAPR